MEFWYQKKGLLLLGAIAGIFTAGLAYMGNPANMALCAACFIRDMAGAMKFHNAAAVQYFRPEIVGIILGAFIVSLKSGEFGSSGSGSTPIRVLLGAIMMICALVFLGCPLRMVLRMSAGDMSAYVGLVGFLGGLATGIVFLKKGYTLGEAVATRKSQGYTVPLLVAVLFIISVVTTLFAVSTKGPGSMHAPAFFSLLAGLIFGIIAQRTRMCFSGAFRNVMMYKDGTMLCSIIGIFVIMLIYNLGTGHFNIAAFGPIAHGDVLWNIASMYGVGLAATLAGGCPLRQLVLAGSGSSDSAMTVLGMLLGAAVAHNFNLAAVPGVASKFVVGGPSISGQVAVIISIIILLGIGIWGSHKTKASTN